MYRVLIIEWKDILIMIMSKEGVYIRVHRGRMRYLGANRCSVSACSRLFCYLLIINRHVLEARERSMRLLINK